METSKLNDLKLKISYQKEEENYSEQHSVIVNIINKNVKDIKNTLKQAGFSRKDKLTISNYDDNFISIEVADYFPEKSTTAEVIEGIKSIKNDINLIKTFDVEFLAAFVIDYLSIRDLAKIIVDETPYDKEIILAMLGVDIDNDCDSLEHYFISTALDYIDRKALYEIFYICIDDGWINLEDIIEVIGNYIDSKDKMETLLYIIWKNLSIKLLITIYQQNNKGQDQSEN